ncbi:hypothetical protein J6590_101442, partial [Homalodisca vitripennis]
MSRNFTAWLRGTIDCIIPACRQSPVTDRINEWIEAHGLFLAISETEIPLIRLNCIVAAWAGSWPTKQARFISKRYELLMSTGQSVFLCGAEVRRRRLRVTAYRTVYEPAVNVISGFFPIYHHALEEQAFYHCRSEVDSDTAAKQKR